MGRLWLLRRHMRNRKGFSTIIATIFLVLVVLFLYFNVFMFIQNQDTKFQDIISQSQQLDADRNVECLTITSPAISIAALNQVNVACTIINNSSLPVKITRVWLKDINTNDVGYSDLLSLSIGPGTTKNVDFQVNLLNASPTDNYHMDLVTFRGNLFSSSFP